jgi:RNA polymerase sigma factor (sigma-70 family)
MGTSGAATPESELWSRARAGDPDAFGDIFDLHRDRVFGQALRLVRNGHDAEDITALVFLELWRRRASVTPTEGTVVGWLLVTTNFVVRNFERSSRRHRAAMSKLPPQVDSPDHSPLVQDALDSRGSRSVVRTAFLRLNRADQDILTLCVLEELGEAQASAALGIPRGTVKSRLSRAKSRLTAIVVASGTSINWEALADER